MRESEMKGAGMDPMDERLQSAAQMAVRSAVKGLPEDTLSMAWRSNLNERLLEVSAQRQRKQRLAWFLRPALGLGLAGALAFAFVLRTGPRPSQIHAGTMASASKSIAADLISVHSQTSMAMDVAGVGVTPVELSYAQQSANTGGVPASDWTETDLDTL